MSANLTRYNWHDIAAIDPQRWAEAVHKVPPLGRSGSWIATIAYGERYVEVWAISDAAMLIIAGCTVRTALDHLSRLNLPATHTGD